MSTAAKPTATAAASATSARACAAQSTAHAGRTIARSRLESRSSWIRRSYKGRTALNSWHRLTQNSKKETSLSDLRCLYCSSWCLCMSVVSSYSDTWGSNRRAKCRKPRTLKSKRRMSLQSEKSLRQEPLMELKTIQVKKMKKTKTCYQTKKWIHPRRKRANPTTPNAAM